MPLLWTPIEAWKDEDCYIIGGGPSLSTFDWRLLLGHNTIGCNSAFRLGPAVVSYCIFGDVDFFSMPLNRKELEAFPNPVVTACPALYRNETPWLKQMKRAPRGLHTNALGWNGCTGAMAINLALLLGARRIFLLGFDMKLDGTRNNWHDYGKRVLPEVFNRFRRGFAFIASDLPVKFPGREVINVNDDSDLNVFPKVRLEDHFGKESL